MITKCLKSFFSDSNTIDTFQSSEGLLFFLIAIIVGAFFVHPLLHVPPSGAMPAIALLPRGRRRSPTPPDSRSSWPTLPKLKHPAAYVFGKRRDNVVSESGADSDEFDRMLDYTSGDEDAGGNDPHLFAKPRFRSFAAASNIV